MLLKYLKFLFYFLGKNLSIGYTFIAYIIVLRVGNWLLDGWKYLFYYIFVTSIVYLIFNYLFKRCNYEKEFYDYFEIKMVK